MNEYRNLYSSEQDCLLNYFKNDPGRKIVRGFFGMWRAVFIICLIGVVKSVIEAILAKEYFILFSVFGVVIAYLWFWKLPGFLLKTVDANYEAVKQNKVFIRETALVSSRMNREKSSKNGNYRNVYYASVWNENKTHTYDVLTGSFVFSMVPGDMVYVLRFIKGKHNVNEEYVIPLNFTSMDGNGKGWFYE